jgi:DNA-binding MarR family transcriptional regulator
MLRSALQQFARSTEVVARRHGLTTERHLAVSTVTQLVRRAENQGLLRRELAPRDARIRYLRLTEEGERRLAAALGELGEERERLTLLLAQAPVTRL